MKLEERLADALAASTGAVEESPDLFDRVADSVAADADRRRWRRRWALRVTAAALALIAVGAAASWQGDGRFAMDWWVLEILVTVVLVILVLTLGPFIKRFGRSYAADVFRSNPGTGKSFIVLTDFAYYLIFSAYVLLTARFEPASDWPAVVSGGQVREVVARVAGMLLIMGLLHSANLLVLPVIGRLLTLNKRLDQQMQGIDHDNGSQDGAGLARAFGERHGKQS